MTQTQREFMLAASRANDAALEALAQAQRMRRVELHGESFAQTDSLLVEARVLTSAAENYVALARLAAEAAFFQG